MRKQRREIEGMGFMTWALRLLWNPITRPLRTKRLCRLLAEFTKHGFYRINFFMFCFDGSGSNAYQKKQVPYLRKADGRYDLMKWNKKYWRLLRIVYRKLRNEGMTPIPCYFMDRYNQFQFRNSVQNVDMWSIDADRYQTRLINKDIAIRERIFGAGPWPARMFNEPIHGGDHTKLRVIGDKHKRLYENSDLYVDVSVNDMYFDNSSCEGVYWWFVGYFEWEGEQHGSEEYLIDGKRAIRVTTHGAALWQDIEADVEAIIHSEWRKPSWQCYSGDGGTTYKDQARGHKLYDPDGNVIWAQGDAEQTYELAHTLYDAAKRHNRNFCYQIAMFETLKGWPLKEDFSIKNIDWSRLDAVVQAHDDVYGEV